MKEFDVGIIGGGPAGSFTAFLLASEGKSVCLFEKKAFPREILCGEFLSYEVSNHLKDAGLFEKFLDLNPNKITSFRLYTSGGKSLQTDLKFTAFGLKRSAFDKFLLDEAKAKGVKIYQPYSVTSVSKNDKGYTISADSHLSDSIEVKAENIIGAYGKSNPIDKLLRRNFSDRYSPFNGVKIHLPEELFRNYNKNEIHIYTADGIYCGINRVNDGSVTVCFLEKRGTKDPPVKEKFLLLRKSNKGFNDILSKDADKEIVNAKVYGAGNIYFGRKYPVENGIYMAGDAAGIIAPLAGDGLGMALETAELIREVFTGVSSGEEKREEYQIKWNKKFRRRIITAGIIQKMMLTDLLLNAGVKLLNIFPGSINALIDYTRK
jgi:menaquinone-9 beta-reductase